MRVGFRLASVVKVEEDLHLPGSEALARLRPSPGLTRSRLGGGVPEKVLADPFPADVKDGADLVEGAAEIS